MKENEIADAIDQLDKSFNSLLKRKDENPGVLEECTDSITGELKTTNIYLADIAEAIRELTQEIGSLKEH